MGNFFARIREGLANLMQGRYGGDSLSMTLIVVGLVISLTGTFIGFDVLSYLSMAILIYVVFRMFSKNTAQRAKEQAAFQRFIAAPKKWFSLTSKKWTNRKTTTYFKCEKCGTVLSVPKGKGKIRTTCPQCKNQTTRNT